LKFNNLEKFLKRIEIKNFLSLQDTIIEFSHFTVLIGPNASGKSNILKVLNFLSYLPKSTSIKNAINKLFKNNKFTDIFYNDSKLITIILNVHLLDREYKYTLSFNDKGKVKKEILYSNDTILINFSGTNGYYIINNKGQKVQINKELNSPVISRKDIQNSFIKTFKSFFNDIKFFHFIPNQIRNYSSSGYNKNLESDGSNLAQVLHTLLTTERELFFKIEDILKNIILVIDRLDTPPSIEGNKVYLTIQEKNIKNLLSFSNISDGTLRLLAFITAMKLSGSIICFEEPENCVHPYLFETLIDIMKNSNKQVIITTHSPYLQDKIELDNVRVVKKVDNKTCVSKIKNIDYIKKMLGEGFTLGELLYMENF